MTTHLNTPGLGFAISIFTFLGVVFGLLRLYVRAFIVRAIGWDDGWLAIALVFSIAGFGILVAILASAQDIDKLFYGKRTGVTHAFKENMPYYHWLSLSEAAMALYTLLNMFSRLSLLFTYRRFTPRDRKYRRRVINFFSILTVIMGLFFSFVEVMPCYPPQFMHYPNHIKGSYCITPRQPFWWGSILGVALDAGIYILPFWLLWRADIAKEYKRALYGMFAFGGLVMIISVVRIPFIWVFRWAWLPTGPAINYNKMMLTWLWTSLESSCLIIAAALPTFRPLLRAANKWRKNMNSRGQSKHDSNQLQNDLEKPGPHRNEKVRIKVPPGALRRPGEETIDVYYHHDFHVTAEPREVV